MRKETLNINDIDTSSLAQRMKAVWHLAVPGILAQISEIAMQYIDAAMVGSLGAAASASIGLVASSTWLVGGLIQGTAAGFYVQIAHAAGAEDDAKARKVLFNGFWISLAAGIALGLIGVLLSGHLPVWLGGNEELIPDAAAYFRIYALFIPVRMLFFLMTGSLQCTGNMKTPSMIAALMCGLDVLFNFLLIFPTRTFHGLMIYGAGMGVAGAALGTALSFVCAALMALHAVFVKSAVLKHRKGERKQMDKDIIREAAVIGLPMALEQSAMSGAQVYSTSIVAPLGTKAIAANSFAVTAEALCYMPGFGIQSAAVAIVGQAVGAKRSDLARSFAWLTTLMGMVIMSVTGILMYFFCPYVFAFLTPDEEVRRLGAEVLRIELHAEPFFGASIVAAGALRGAGDTLIPGIMNLVSIWGVRITLAKILVGTMGLPGVWTAMMIELIFRGVIFLIRLYRQKWQLKSA
jgi:putative MATE family efflux protein